MIKESSFFGVSRSSCSVKENTANKHIFHNYGIYKHTFVWYNKTNKPPEGNMNNSKDILKEIERLSTKLNAAQLKIIIEKFKNHRATDTNVEILCSQLLRK